MELKTNGIDLEEHIAILWYILIRIGKIVNGYVSSLLASSTPKSKLAFYAPEITSVCSSILCTVKEIL